ncbi:MAG: DUF4157 domain-containing protein [Lentisphaeraceae bacterium]|nr:DUF4157 domain-containing protein [Lentisphaeraceae bacterium]
MIKKGKKRVRGKRASAYRRNTRRKRGNSMPSKHSLSWYSDSHIPEIAGEKDPLEKEAEKTSSKASGLASSVQMKSDGVSKNSVSSTFAKTLNQTKNSGTPLPEKTQKSMSSKMGSSFKDVRIHKGKEADSMSKEINAKAFTYGRDIFFKEGHFQPDSKEGQRLIAHELVHTQQQSSMIHREALGNAANQIQLWRFKIGLDLTPEFIAKAKKLSSDGPLTTDEINELRMHSIIQRGTVTHSERLLMAALLNQSAINIVQANVNISFDIPAGMITSANRNTVRQSGKSNIPENIILLLSQNLNQASTGDIDGMISTLKTLNKEATKAILKEAATYKRKMARVIAFAKKKNVFLPDVLRAMVNGASDNSNGDKYMAGLAYTVLNAAGQSKASKILSGDLKIDALSDSAFNKSSNASAQYNPSGEVDFAKGDTMYLRTSLDIDNVASRAIIVHEFIHFLQDFNAVLPAVAPGTVSKLVARAIPLEIEAYQAQVKYIMDQILNNTDPKKHEKMVTQASKDLIFNYIQWAYILVTENDMKYEDLTIEILTKHKDISEQDVLNATNRSRADLIAEMTTALMPDYGAKSILLDGNKGPSLMDH